MATKKKMLQATAGNAGGGAALDITDVFSTYLYEGNGSSQAINNGIALADGIGGGTSTEFDGSSDYLQRGTTFTNNTNSKTLTLSFWFRWDDGLNENERIFGFFGDSTGSNTNAGLAGYISTSDKSLKITHGNQAFNWVTPNNTIVKGKWTHFLMSIDMDTQSNTKIYIDDVAITGTYSYFVTGTAIKGDTAFNTIGAFWNNQYTQTYKGNLAHFYVDYTWRDLATTSNRRIFIDANGGSTSASSLAANNPILYFPMTDAYSLGENTGTGGDLTAYGSPTIADSGTEWLSGYGEGGLVWVKKRTNASGHQLFDTDRGAGYRLWSDTTDSQDLSSGTLTSFNSNGFSIGGADIVNDGVGSLTSWTFRKAPKFFDVVTYTGDGVAGRTVSHKLGCEVGFMVVKRTDSTGSWTAFHKDLNGGANPEDYAIILDTAAGQVDQSLYWNDTAPTSTNFTLGTASTVNASGGTYVAYLFAHNDGDGEFGPDGDQDIIKCGSYTGNGADQRTIDLGFEAQWVLVKRYDGSYDWTLFDNMRGLPVRGGGSSAYLEPNTANSEATTGQLFGDNQGFMVDAGDFNTTGENYIYIAIRRGPLAPPESATEVFGLSKDTVVAYSSVGFPVDMVLGRSLTTQNWRNFARMIGGDFLVPNLPDAQASLPAGEVLFDSNDGFYNETNATPNIWHQWKRAPGFFDIVSYTGVAAAQTLTHNLGVVPEMIWIKKRSEVSYYGFVVYHGTTGNMYLSNTFSSGYGGSNAVNHSTISDTTFQLANGNIDVNDAGETHIAYLFASLPGISKVGSYTGNGSSIGDTQTIDCGFSSGARFVLIKRTSGTGEWFVFDTERGIVAGSDAYLTLHSTAAQVSGGDYIDPHSSGFTVVQHPATETNTLGDTYMFYAIA
jgi:hypothetical protein